MNRNFLFEQIKKKNSVLCVGLDVDITKIPTKFLDYEDPIYEFNKMVIEATQEYCVAYKPNLAFYEAHGPKGLVSLEKTMKHIPTEVFTIADAKRGDIGNTAQKYAETFFEYFKFDSITLSPYMGMDTIEPFLQYENKWAIMLGLTSNAGSEDFQKLNTENPLYIEVLKAGGNVSPDKLMFVIGATHPEKINEIRQLVPEHFFLVPGVGAQGGDLNAVLENGWNTKGGLLINSSRGIIYAKEDGQITAASIHNAAKKLQEEMSLFIQSKT